MKFRVATAYSVPAAFLGVIVIVVAGVTLGRMTVGVTRQPLPLIWPLAVMHVVVAQLPLRAILGSVERVAARGSAARGLRAVAAVILLLGALAYIAGNRELLVLFVILAGVGFVAAAAGGAQSWAWTLCLGLLIVGLSFLTPLGGPIERALDAVPPAVAGAAAALSAIAYSLTGSAARSRAS